MHAFNVLNLGDLVLVKGQNSEMGVLFQILNGLDAVLVEEKLAKVGVLGNVVDLRDLVVREVNPLESCWWVEVQHLSELVRTSI